MAVTLDGPRVAAQSTVPEQLVVFLHGYGANVVEVTHLREGMDLHLRETAIHLVLQTNGPDHDEEILGAVKAEGFSVRIER